MTILQSNVDSLLGEKRKGKNIFGNDRVCNPKPAVETGLPTLTNASSKHLGYLQDSSIYCMQSEAVSPEPIFPIADVAVAQGVEPVAWGHFGAATPRSCTLLEGLRC